MLLEIALRFWGFHNKAAVCPLCYRAVIFLTRVSSSFQTRPTHFPNRHRLSLTSFSLVTAIQPLTMSTNRNYDYLIKLLLIGDSGTLPNPFLVRCYDMRIRGTNFRAKGSASHVFYFDSARISLRRVLSRP